MRALLVNPWIYDFAAYDLWNKPLGLLNIASRLQKYGFEISLLDCLDRLHPLLDKAFRDKQHTKFGDGAYYAEEIDKPAVFSKIPRVFKRYGLPRETVTSILSAQPAPDIILVTSGMTYWYPSYFDMIDILKKRFPATPIILGGIYATICPDHAAQFSKADAVCKGSDITELFKLITEHTGFAFDAPPASHDQDTFPAYSLYTSLAYATLRTSRGCPYRCTYCGWHLVENGFSRQDTEYVLNEIEYLYNALGVNNFAFYDDALLYEAKDHIIKILEGIIKRKITANFHTPNGLHNRFMTDRIAELSFAANFKRPRLALETSSKDKQNSTGAKTTTDDFLKALASLKKAGYRSSEIGVNILIGLPKQDIDEVRHTVQFAADKNLRIHLEEYSPIPGTPDYKMSGLSPDADPLLHNNSAFPLYDGEGYKRFQEIKDLSRELNNGRVGREDDAS